MSLSDSYSSTIPGLVLGSSWTVAWHFRVRMNSLKLIDVKGLGSSSETVFSHKMNFYSPKNLDSSPLRTQTSYSTMILKGLLGGWGYPKTLLTQIPFPPNSKNPFVSFMFHFVFFNDPGKGSLGAVPWLPKPGLSFKAWVWDWGLCWAPQQCCSQSLS